MDRGWQGGEVTAQGPLLLNLPEDAQRPQGVGPQMGYEEADAWREEADQAAFDSFFEDPSVRSMYYEDLFDEIVKDFAAGRLGSFFSKQPNAAEAPFRALADARSFRGTHHTAAFLFATVAIEVGLRTALLKPVVYGLVHAEAAAPLVASLALASKHGKFQEMLLDLLESHGGVDPRKHTRPGSSKALWKEMEAITTKRNRVVHQAEAASATEADEAMAVAASILEDLFPALLGAFGFHLHGHSACDAFHRPVT